MRLRLVAVFILFFAVAAFAQGEFSKSGDAKGSEKESRANKSDKKTTEKTDSKTTDSSSKGDTSSGDNYDFTGSLLIGAVTIDGQNYQQIGFRPEIRLYKLGFGLDVQVLLDEDGNVRQEDWNNYDAYLDKIYYISWGKKNKDPFYIKFGGLKYTYLGYRGIVDGYSNMVEYPTYKRQGLEMAFKGEKFGGELLINNIKELWHGTPSVLIGGRATYKIVGNLAIGLSIAADLNEYSGLRDSDGDGYPDEIDAHPYNSDYVTEIDRYRAKGITDQTTLDNLVAAGLLDGTEVGDLTKYSDKTSRSAIAGADIGYPIIKTDFLEWEVYSQFAYMINTKGWGFSAPATRLKIAFVTFTAEYRQSSDKFLFGYYNNTYELERARFVDDGTGKLVATTKVDSLETVKAVKGYFGSVSFNIMDLVTFDMGYQQLFDGDSSTKSIRGELVVNSELIPKVSEAKAYYIRNNSSDFTTWRTPGTIMGAVVSVELVDGAELSFNYLWTFEDKDGNGVINGDDETIKNISVSAKTLF